MLACLTQGCLAGHTADGSTVAASRAGSSSKDSNASVLAVQVASQGFCLLADWAVSLAGGQQEQQEWMQQLLQFKQQVRACKQLSFAVCFICSGC
jgi:hypothetical protein